MSAHSTSSGPAADLSRHSRQTATADDIRGIARRRILDQLLPLLEQGKTFAEAAQLIPDAGSAASLWRLKKAWDHDGEAGLRTKHANAGRRALTLRADGTGVFTEADIAFVKRKTIESESLPLALERLSDVGPCSAEARALIDRYRHSGDYPPSFYKIFHITAEEWAMAKGEKTFDGVTHTARRGMWYVDADGQRRELFAGGLVEADDVSVDTPYYVQLPDGSYSVGRQVLCFRDRRARKWIGAYGVARERDSYRGEDIARATRELILAWGLIERFRFERGSWESAPIKGIKVSGLPSVGSAKEGGETRWGGVASLIPVQHVFKSRGKGTIEGGFRMLHKVLGLYGVRIGKKRGEYEEPTADMLAVNAGKKDPRACGFIAWADLLKVFDQAFTLLNTRPVFFSELAAKRSPDDVWAQDMAARPGGRLPACDADLLWHFLPVKTEIGAGIAQAGHVKVSVPGYPLPFFFRIGGPVLLHSGDGVPAGGIERNAPFIERGHRLIVAFDPQRAAEGAVIFNAERGPKNTQGWRPFEKIMTAPLAGEAPQFTLRPGEARGSDDLVAKRTRDQQVRASFTSIGMYGQGARHVTQDHDGRGNVARVESGAASRTVAPAAPVRTPRAEFAAAMPKHRHVRPAGPVDEDFTITSRSQVAPSPRVEAPLVEEW
jgi:hypothetical protein